MSRFRTRWLALFGAVTLLSLSLSTALAGGPDDENRGQQVSAFVHSLVGADEETEEDTEVEEDTDTDEETEEEEEEESAPSDHGQCVAQVAQDKEAVGPPNDNHGGAVSEAARVTCWEDEAGSVVESNEDGDSEDSEESEDEDAEESEDAEDSDDAEDAEESDGDSDHGNGHGHDDEGEGSDD